MDDKNKLVTILQTLKHYLFAILFALIATYFIIEYFHPVIVSGNSMKPTLQSGDLLVSTNTFKETDINRGDIIVFEQDGVQFLKRIVAVPGDEVWIENGIIYVNGKESEYKFELIEDAGILNEHTLVLAEEYICIGDNRNESLDSREFGSVKFSQFKYKILLTFEEKGDKNDKNK